jgi:fluoride exporter
VARYGAHIGLHRMEWPLPTLVVNLVGSFLLGALLLGKGPNDTARFLVGIGFLGAFTTLSAYSVEVLEMWRSGAVWRATLHVLGNGLGGPLMAMAGWRVASWL